MTKLIDRPAGWIMLRLAAVAAAIASLPMTAQALGTPAGTEIQSTASVSYSIGGTAASTSSNTAAVMVAEIVDVSVTLQSPTHSVAAGMPGVALIFLLTNIGNSSEAFLLTGDSVLVGDDFDPIPATPFIYIDTDASGDLSAADIPYVPGSNDPVLAADDSLGVIVVNDIPAGLADGQLGRSELRADALTGTGAPGTLVAGAGPGGIDALIGSSGASVAVSGEYLIGDISVTAIKTQSVTDPFGGSRPVPGAEIVYQVVVNATGSGAALGVEFSDDIPAYTTYVAGSLTLNGSTLSDAADADAGNYISTPAAIAVSLGDLTAADGPQSVEFTVSID